MPFKNKILIVLLLLNFTISLSQDITLSELVNLKNLDVPNATRDLENRNWKIVTQRKPIDNFGEILFVYNKETTEKGMQKMVSFFYSSNDNDLNRIYLQTGINDFVFYKSQLELLEFKFITSSLEEKMKVEVYQNKTTTIIVSEPTDKNDIDLFYFYVMNNPDYFKNIREKATRFKKEY